MRESFLAAWNISYAGTYLMTYTSTLSALMFSAMLSTQALAAVPGYVTAVVAGLPDPNGKVPAINAVPGAGVNTLSVAVPVAHLLQGQTFTYVVASQNSDFAGTCTTSYAITRPSAGANQRMLDTAKITSFPCKANLAYSWSITSHPVPSSPGPAMLTGIVRFGGTTERLSVPVVIQ